MYVCLCFRGIWSVSYISRCYLIKSKVVEDENTRPSYKSDNLDYDIAFSKSLSEKVCWIIF